MFKAQHEINIGFEMDETSRRWITDVRKVLVSLSI